MEKIKCDECNVNDAEYLLINGEEQLRLCEPSMKDRLLELVTQNDTITFGSGDKKEMTFGSGIKEVKQRMQVIEIM